MQSKRNKLIIETLLQDVISLVNRIDLAVDPAKSFRVRCREMGKQVYQLSQMLESLLRFIILEPILQYLNLIHYVISRVSRILKETLNLARKCKCKTIFCRLFTGTEITSFHNLYHLLDVCFTNRTWLLIIYNTDFGSAFDEIFPKLLQILSNDSSITLAWSCMFTDNMIWELAMLTIEGISPLNGRMVKGMEALNLVEAEHGELQFNCFMATMEIAAAEYNLHLRRKSLKTNSPGANAIVEQLSRVNRTREVLATKWIGSLARIFYDREKHHVISALVSQLGNEHQEVATEAFVALKNFACRKDDYLHKAHSKRMIEFNAAQPLVKLLRDDGRTQQLQRMGA